MTSARGFVGSSRDLPGVADESGGGIAEYSPLVQGGGDPGPLPYEDVQRGRNLVKHAVPEWIPCPDGTTAPGLEVYPFYRASDAGLQDMSSKTWIGEDQTTGVSGNCGRNRSLVLNMPLKITELT
jgi:hypothetical protein